MKMNEKSNLENNKIYDNNKMNDYNSENESEDSFSDLEPLDKRKLRKNKEKNFKFNIKRNNKIFDKLVNKNDKIDNEKTKNYRKRKRKNYQLNEERKIKDRVSTSNKPFFERKTD
ncbi:hypothetical protein H8356DRAFT_846370, partial [Neocallimastix lanati (nom. inval.)]|uniref:Uncharacterized protein n=1 Tax=Neocallimastix californiae TaxID=1754190 RepID=A0A1Y2ACF9_9FUNG|eukprot:ORY20201.1 hypothetical protein LY90DRAFT_516969 [Neocallimastix californiae]